MTLEIQGKSIEVCGPYCDISNPYSAICVSYCASCKNTTSYSSSYSYLGAEYYMCPETQLFCVNDNRIKLSNRAFRVLCALFKSAGEPVQFNYLHKYGWPDGLFVRNNLTVTISEIRTALRHTGIKIDNVRGVGYVLTSHISEKEQVGAQQCSF